VPALPAAQHVAAHVRRDPVEPRAEAPSGPRSGRKLRQRDLSSRWTASSALWSEPSSAVLAVSTSASTRYSLDLPRFDARRLPPVGLRTVHWPSMLRGGASCRYGLTHRLRISSPRERHREFRLAARCRRTTARFRSRRVERGAESGSFRPAHRSSTAGEGCEHSGAPVGRRVERATSTNRISGVAVLLRRATWQAGQRKIRWCCPSSREHKIDRARLSPAIRLHANPPRSAVDHDRPPSSVCPAWQVAALAQLA